MGKTKETATAPVGPDALGMAMLHAFGGPPPDDKDKVFGISGKKLMDQSVLVSFLRSMNDRVHDIEKKVRMPKKMDVHTMMASQEDTTTPLAHETQELCSTSLEQLDEGALLTSELVIVDQLRDVCAPPPTSQSARITQMELEAHHKQLVQKHDRAKAKLAAVSDQEVKYEFEQRVKEALDPELRHAAKERCEEAQRMVKDRKYLKEMELKLEEEAEVHHAPSPLGPEVPNRHGPLTLTRRRTPAFQPRSEHSMRQPPSLR